MSLTKEIIDHEASMKKGGERGVIHMRCKIFLNFIRHGNLWNKFDAVERNAVLEIIHNKRWFFKDFILYKR